MENISLTLQDMSGAYELAINKKKLDNYITFVPDVQGKSYEDAVWHLLKKFYSMADDNVGWNGIKIDMETLGMSTLSEMVSFLMTGETVTHLPVCGNCDQYIENDNGYGLGICCHVYGALSVFSQRDCWSAKER